MSPRKVRFTAVVNWDDFTSIDSLITQGGGQAFDITPLGEGQTGRRKGKKGIHHNIYKKNAQDIIFDAFSSGITLTISQIKKALSTPMPTGTISGSLAKLRKAGKIVHAGKGKWKLK